MQKHMIVNLKKNSIDNARFLRLTALAAGLILLAALASSARAASQYVQHNLVSDVPGIADQTDPNLVNRWGISMSSTSPFWISNNHAGIAAVYNGQGQPPSGQSSPRQDSSCYPHEALRSAPPDPHQSDQSNSAH